MRKAYRCLRCGNTFGSYRDASSHYVTVHKKGQPRGTQIEAAKDAIVKE